MLQDHALDSRLDTINIKIYFEHWHQDHRFEEMNMILRVWLQEKNSNDGFMSRSRWSDELSHG
jgi:hypothetical protein